MLLLFFLCVCSKWPLNESSAALRTITLFNSECSYVTYDIWCNQNEYDGLGHSSCFLPYLHLIKLDVIFSSTTVVSSSIYWVFRCSVVDRFINSAQYKCLYINRIAFQFPRDLLIFMYTTVAMIFKWFW